MLHTYKFTFVIGLLILSDLRDNHWSSVAEDRGIRLEEDGRKRRRRSSSFLDYWP
jgi:hypothetical protein